MKIAPPTEIESFKKLSSLVIARGVRESIKDEKRPLYNYEEKDMAYWCETDQPSLNESLAIGNELVVTKYENNLTFIRGNKDLLNQYYQENKEIIEIQRLLHLLHQ